MTNMSSTASRWCQEPLHLRRQAALYAGDMAVADKIHLLRKAHNLSLEKFAQKLDVTRQAVWQWEQGGQIRRKHVEALCRTFEVPYEYFYGKSDTSQLETLESKTRRLPPDQRKIIEAAVDAFLAQQPSVRKAVK